MTKNVILQSEINCPKCDYRKTETMPTVPYFIYGHDHAAHVRAIRTPNQPDFRQWYINTGAWVPIFSDNERLLRDDEQLTFLRIVPSRLTSDARSANRDTPELLQWSAEANAPRPVRLFT